MYEGSPEQHFGPTTYSQHGEDIFIMSVFRLLGVHKPSYLDLGAHHPITISNTALMYSLGCRGVNVEANPVLIENFRRMRPEDRNVSLGVGLKEGFEEFYMWDEESGRNSFNAEEMFKNLDKEGRTLGGMRHIRVQTLKFIVDEYCDGVYPDFLNCDIEDMDYDVLNSAEFNDKGPTIICVETRLEESFKMTEMMIGKGYQPRCRVGENIIYVDNHSHHLLDIKKGMGRG